MTPQASTAFAERSRTVPPEPRHQHDSACYWDVDDCRWQCATYPLVSYALERCTSITRPFAGTGPASRPEERADAAEDQRRQWDLAEGGMGGQS
jgi:hypothetical protein